MSAQVILHCDAPVENSKDCGSSFTGGYGASAEFIRKAASAQAGWRSDRQETRNWQGELVALSFVDYCSAHNR